MQPQSVEAERSVIGGLLISPEGWDAIAEIVVAEDFYRPEHRAIFRQIAKLVDLGQPVDVNDFVPAAASHGTPRLHV